MTEGTMNKYPSTVTGKTIEQIAEEKLDAKAKEYADEQITVYKIAYSYSEIEGAFYKAFKDGYHWSYVKDRCDAVKQTGFEDKVDMENLVNGAIPKISKIEKEITELHEEEKRKLREVTVSSAWKDEPKPEVVLTKTEEKHY